MCQIVSFVFPPDVEAAVEPAPVLAVVSAALAAVLVVVLVVLVVLVPVELPHAVAAIIVNARTPEAKAFHNLDFFISLFLLNSTFTAE